MSLKSKSVLWISGLLALACQIAIAVILMPLGSQLKILQHQITVSPSEFQSILTGWGSEGTSRFLTHYYVDLFFYPICYSIFLAACLARTKIGNSKTWFVFLPFFAGLLDVFENLIHMSIISGSLAPSSPLFYVAALCAQAKWVIVITTIAFIVQHIASSRTKKMPPTESEAS